MKPSAQCFPTLIGILSIAGLEGCATPAEVTQRPADMASVTSMRLDPTTSSRILPSGAVSSVVQGASGGSGAFTGSLVVATGIHDAQMGRLLAAAVRRYTPPVFDTEATLSAMDTARSGALQAARDLRAAVDIAEGKALPLHRMPTER